MLRGSYCYSKHSEVIGASLKITYRAINTKRSKFSSRQYSDGVGVEVQTNCQYVRVISFVLVSKRFTVEAFTDYKKRTSDFVP